MHNLQVQSVTKPMRQLSIFKRYKPHKFTMRKILTQLNTENKKTIMAISFATVFTLTLMFAPSATTVNASTPTAPFCNSMEATVWQISGSTWEQEGEMVTFAANGDGYIIKGTGNKHFPVDNVIVGTPGTDIISGGGGNDTICALGGDDLVKGGYGDDWLDGGDGIDEIRGGLGTDALHCSFTQVGGDGDLDTAKGGWGADTFGVSCNFDSDIIEPGKTAKHKNS